MGLKNPIHDSCTHFLALHIVNWVDVFTRPVYKDIIVDSLRYCQRYKGLEIIARVVMIHHLHIKAGAEGNLSDTLRNFKKFTSKRIAEEAQANSESRRIWMVFRFAFLSRFAKKNVLAAWKRTRRDHL